MLNSLTHQTTSLKRSARLFLIAVVIDGIAISNWWLFFNFYILERGFSKEYLGLVNAMPSIAALIFGIPLGVLSDRLGRKISMIIGVGVNICCMALQLLLLSPTLILLAAFIGGLAAMLFYISQAPFMMKVSDKDNRALLFSLSYGLWTISGAAGNLFAGQLPDLFAKILQVPARDAAAYQAVLLVSVAISILTIIPLIFLRDDRSQEQNQTNAEKTSIWKILVQPLTLKLALPNLIIGFGAAVLMPYMNVFFLDKFALPDQKLGILFSLLALLTGLGSIIGPKIANVLGGKIKAVVLTQLTSVVFLIILGFSPILTFSAISFLFRGVLMNMAVPLYHAFAMEHVNEQHYGALNSILELNWQMGWAVGPYISGIVQERYGFDPLFAMTSILYAMATIVVWFLFRKSDGGLPIQAE